MRFERVLATAAGFLAAGAVLAAMFWLVDVDAVVAAAAGADPWLLLVVAGTVLAWNVAWGLALWNVLRAQAVAASVWQAVLVNAAAGFANHVTPFGQAGGEPVTAWVLAQTADVEYEVGLASVASLDAINVWPSVTFAGVGLGYYALTATDATRSELGALPAVAVLAAVAVPVLAVLAWRNRRRGQRVVVRAVAGLWRGADRLLPFFPSPAPSAVSGRVTTFVTAVERVAADRRRFAAAVGCSALGWGVQAVGLWVTFLALDAPIPVHVAFFVVPLGTMGGVVPTPGGLGGTEVINVGLVTVATGVAAPVAAAAVTIHSVGGYVLTTTVGAAATSALGLRAAA